MLLEPTLTFLIPLTESLDAKENFQFLFAVEVRKLERTVSQHLKDKQDAMSNLILISAKKMPALPLYLQRLLVCQI